MRQMALPALPWKAIHPRPRWRESALLGLLAIDRKSVV